jgi:hypothetical protein
MWQFWRAIARLIAMLRRRRKRSVFDERVND